MTKFQDYFTEQIKNFNEYHSRLLIEVNKEDIHKLRTTIKKLRTFNILLDGLLFRDKDFPIELKNLFNKLGEIRDIQIQQKILDEYEDNIFKKNLSLLYNHKISLFEINTDFDNEFQYLSDKLDKVEDYHIDDQIIINIKSHIENSFNEIYNMMENISPSILHSIRSKLKRIYYTLILLGEKNEKMYDVQEVIGLWHDYDVIIHNMDNFRDDASLFFNYDIFLSVLSKLKDKRELLYNESVELIKNYKLL